MTASSESELYTVVGDLHLRPKSLDESIVLFDIVERLGKPTIWLGDMLDTKEVIRGKCLNLLVDYFSKSSLRHVVLVGNHDYFNLDCSAHSLEPLKLLPNVTVVDKPTELGNLVFFPYVHDKEVLLKSLKRYADPGKTLFAHLDVSNFDYGNGHVSTTGIALGDLAGFKAVVSGHFHKFQKSGNLTFLGTPMSKDFGEANQTKYIGMFAPETGELKVAETSFPKHVSLKHRCSQGIVIRDFNLVDFYRVILVGSKDEIAAFPKEAYSRFNIKWLNEFTDEVDSSVPVDESMSNEKQFYMWATEIKKMDQKTVELGLSILGACR